ncbi:MAG TPA: AI-2E family transporter [Chloroflexota bacterium]|nr:AI-2E family transporter [Chloroflexota bacterium]
MSDPEATPAAVENVGDAGVPDPDTSTMPIEDDPLPLPRRGLLERDWQKALVVLLTVLVALVLIWVAMQIVRPFLPTLLLFTLSGVLAFVLAAPVDALAAHARSRLVAIITVYLLFGVTLVGGLMLLAGPFVGQASALLNDLPRYAGELEAHSPELESALGQYGLRANWDDLKVRAATALQEGGTEILGRLVGTVAQVGGLLVDTLLALVISFYFLLDGPTMRRRLLALIPPDHRGKALFVEANAGRVLGGYLRGQLAMAGTIGAVAGLGCSLLGLPYALVLGVLAGLFELVPMFGPILSAIPAVVIALFLPFPTVLWVVLFFFVVQQIESNVLGPRITGHAVGLHPLAAMFALLAGLQLAGLLGALFAVPVAGIVWVLIAEAYRHAVSEVPQPRRGMFSRFQRAPALAPTDAPTPEPKRP